EGDAADPKPPHAASAPPAGVRALTRYRDAVDSGASPRTLPAGGDLAGAFTNGYAAMWQSGIWQVVAMNQNAPDHPYGMFSLPVPPGGHEQTALGGWAFVMNSRGRDPDSAARFAVNLDRKSVV